MNGSGDLFGSAVTSGVKWCEIVRVNFWLGSEPDVLLGGLIGAGRSERAPVASGLGCERPLVSDHCQLRSASSSRNLGLRSLLSNATENRTFKGRITRRFLCNLCGHISWQFIVPCSTPITQSWREHSAPGLLQPIQLERLGFDPT